MKNMHAILTGNLCPQDEMIDMQIAYLELREVPETDRNETVSESQMLFQHPGTAGKGLVNGSCRALLDQAAPDWRGDMDAGRACLQISSSHC